MSQAANQVPRAAGPRATFDRALESVKDDVLRLGARVEDALERAGRALVQRDSELADRVRWDDAQVNELQRQINTEITTLIAT
ncbi:MAG: PhoU domain-containing protein, partial [Candidatus Limnocylindria bacterium]